MCGAEDFFNYVYAVLHSEQYRQRYAQFLKIEFPRIPPTSILSLFNSLACLGEELVALHLLESEVLDRPYSMIGVPVICHESSERARFLAGASALSFLRLRQGHPATMPTPEEAATYPYSAAERAAIEQRLTSAILGTPEQVKAGLEDLRNRYEVDELMITTIAHAPSDRMHSFELVAQACAVAPLPV